MIENLKIYREKMKRESFKVESKDFSFTNRGLSTNTTSIISDRAGFLNDIALDSFLIYNDNFKNAANLTVLLRSAFFHSSLHLFTLCPIICSRS